MLLTAQANCNIQPCYFPDMERQVPAQNLPAGWVPLTTLVSGIVLGQRQKLLVADVHHERTRSHVL